MFGYSEMEIINWVCWGLFLFVWTAGIIYNIANGPKVAKRRTRYVPSILIAIFIVWVIRKYSPRNPFEGINIDVPFIRTAGAIILILFTILTIWARFKLGSMWSGSVTLKENHELRTDGPYSIVRHPIYTGILGMLIGSTLMFGAESLTVLVLVLIYILYKIHEEERLMIETFGEQYLEYQKRVPQLIPNIFGKRN